MSAEHPPTNAHSVLILGTGIHGAALARELVLNGIAVTLVDTGDLATGATSKSSRLIHGGLRYLEYGDVRLVRESLIERGRLLKLAPQFVRPLRLFVPTRRRWSGLLRSALGFFKLERTRLGRRLMGRTERRAPRGYWPIRIGLWMYDLFSWGDGLPKSKGTVIGRQRKRAQSDALPPSVDSSRYRRFCEYSDGQMLFPERCVIALLSDAEQVAAQNHVPLRIVPYARIQWRDSKIHISSPSKISNFAEIVLSPELVINTSGAWGDLTLKEIDAATTPLFAGTKGSHFVTRQAELKQRLGKQGIYAETGDRRLAFVLPFGDAVLVGTTDEHWSGIPDQAVASDEELAYLLDVVKSVFDLKLERSDIESHYSGVRPLPRTTDINNAAVTRDHSLVEHRLHGVLILSLVGGKLTTFRSVAQQIANRVLKRLGCSRVATTIDRVLLGGEQFPRDTTQWPTLWQSWADEFQTTVDEVAALWPLYGTRARTVLSDVAMTARVPIADCPFSRRTICWMIEQEWVTSLDDLIERRTMLLFAPQLTIATLHDLAECLVDCGRLPSDQIQATVDATRQRLLHHYGRDVLR